MNYCTPEKVLGKKIGKSRVEMLLDFKKTCRLCLHQDSCLTPIFNEADISDTSLSLPSRILACVSIEVSEEI